MTKIGVIGTGYVGLVTGACLSKWHDVVCHDKNKAKIAKLNKGKIPFYEPGLKGLVDEGLESGRLTFTNDIYALIEDSNTIFLCVGTPSNRNGSCNVRALEAVCTTLSLQPVTGKLIVVKSTVPPGTNDTVIKKINSLQADYYCASNPEFLREGSAVDDFFRAERVVLGIRDEESLTRLLSIYSPIDCDKIPMDVRSAELSKYACNAALAAKISFINEISNLCEASGANVNSVREAMETDSRIGGKFYKQGPGFGGSCFPKDVRALAHFAQSCEEDTPVITGILRTNETQPKRVVAKIKKHLNLETDTDIAIWGAAFKPETDDARCSTTIEIVSKLLEHKKVKIRIHDPQAIPNLKKVLPKSKRISYYTADPIEMAIGTDALVIATPWKEYCAIPVSQIPPCIIVDCRQMFTREEVEVSGKVYEGFGV